MRMATGDQVLGINNSHLLTHIHSFLNWLKIKICSTSIIDTALKGPLITSSCKRMHIYTRNIQKKEKEKENEVKLK